VLAHRARVTVAENATTSANLAGARSASGIKPLRQASAFYSVAFLDALRPAPVGVAIFCVWTDARSCLAPSANPKNSIPTKTL
jgi:hypothetical protein